MDSLNEKTVVGVFEDYRTAERAALEIANDTGIARDAIQVKSNFMTGAAGRSGEAEHTHEGGISGFFHRLFGGGESEEYGGHYAEAVRRGNAVVCVTALPDQVERVARIMNSAGAIDIDRHVENFRSTGYERHDPDAPPYSYDEAAAERERFRGAERRESVPVVEEELQIGKRPVAQGGVRVHSHVVEKPVEENIELREEHVRVERRPADWPAEGDQFRERSIEVTETREEPVVQKRARVKEDVVVGKDTTTRTQNVRDTVRKTEVEVDRMNAGDVGRDSEYVSRWASDPRYQGRSWSDVEEDLRTDYMRNNPNSSWDRVKGSIRAGWEKATGKR
jgi:uncharacterized protein (TIGR02271 family)